MVRAACSRGWRQTRGGSDGGHCGWQRWMRGGSDGWGTAATAGSDADQGQPRPLC